MKNVWVGYVVPGGDDADRLQRKGGNVVDGSFADVGLPVPGAASSVLKKACDLLPETSAATVRGVTARAPQGPGPFDHIKDIEAPLIWHLGCNGSEEIQEIDYVEAEVESTDTVEPHLDELFGEKLLIAKFCLADTLDKPTSRSRTAIVASDEITAPPGTVLNKQAKRHHTSVVLQNTRKNGSSTSSSIGHLLLQSANGKVDDSLKRPDSVSSQQTFILENSRRRPLVARDPFKIGFVLK
ncbi:unnamed protein product [Litomosoides sigmodontis]|uniref:Uncharacterized protein n=1 Tax=Litomosoides sigmodontis TaxID=42156 RepID=A0A3P6URU5_LITSI|nr:unnamed protein product [Litomosoides sigmodontis]